MMMMMRLKTIRGCASQAYQPIQHHQARERRLHSAQGEWDDDHDDVDVMILYEIVMMMIMAPDSGQKRKWYDGVEDDYQDGGVNVDDYYESFDDDNHDYDNFDDAICDDYDNVDDRHDDAHENVVEPEQRRWWWWWSPEQRRWVVQWEQGSPSHQEAPVHQNCDDDHDDDNDFGDDEENNVTMLGW